MKVLVAQSLAILWEPMDHSPSGSSVYGIFQERILEWVAIFSSRGSSQPGDLPNPGIDPGSPALHEDSLPSESAGKIFLIDQGIFTCICFFSPSCFFFFFFEGMVHIDSIACVCSVMVHSLRFHGP